MPDNLGRRHHRLALERIRGLIGAYGEALGRTRNTGELTHRLLKLVRQQVETEAELEGVRPQSVAATPSSA